MRLRALLFASAALVVAFSCGGSKEEPDPKPQPQPQPPTPSVIAVESIALNKAELNLEPGGTETLVATVAPENATDKTVTWTSSTAEVATVADGKVTAVKEGEATITATVGGKMATCKVTVKSSGMSTDDPEGFEDGGEIEW